MNRRLQSIQMLRGVAALGVVVHHIFMVLRDHPSLAGRPLFAPIFGFANFGATGVDLFFVISGFIMAHVIGRGRDGATDFLLDRAARILPMFWLASFAYIGWMLLRGASFGPGAYIGTVLPVTFDADGGYRFPALYAGWTLAFEFCFYAIAAMVIAFRPARAVPLLAAIVSLLALGGLTPALRALAPLAFNPILGEFALGILVWMAWRGEWRGISGSTLTIGVLLLALVVVSPLTPGISVHPDNTLSGAGSLSRLIFLGLPYAVIVAGALHCAPREGIAARLFGRLGDASYSIYLIHPLVLEMARAALSGGPQLGPEMLAVVLLIASAAAGVGVHIAIERPLLRGLKALRSRLHRPAAHRITIPPSTMIDWPVM
ncbi:MAG: acyltransferase [Sphingomonas bacterium]